MVGGRSRTALALFLAILALAAALAPVMGNPGGNPEKNYKLCGNSIGCHGLMGNNSSMANVTMDTDHLVVYVGEEDIKVRVDVTGAEQRTGDPIGVLLLRDLWNPSRSLPSFDGWMLLEDPKGRTPGFNYNKFPAAGISGNTSTSFTWRLKAPEVPGNYTLFARMHTGVDDIAEQPLLREDLEGLTFHVVPIPVVEDTTPRNDTVDVYVNTPIVMIFNKEMDRPTVEAAFSITPHVNGTFTWEGPVARLNVDGFLEEATTYTFTLDTTAIDSDGIPLTEPLDVTFTTGSGVDVYPPRVLSVVSSRAPLDALVLITFDEPMDRASVVGGFSIDPPVEGTLTWRADTIIFTPSGPLEYDTLYTIHIEDTARDLGGNAMGVDLYTGFLTVADNEPPVVLASSPAPGATDVPLVTNVSLAFSPDVNTSTLSPALSWDPPVVVDIVWDGPNATLVPRHALEEGTLYNLTITGSLLDVRGNPLDPPFLLSFLTAGSTDRTPPRLVASVPTPGSRVSPDGTVRLTFSEDMDPMTVEAGIMVSPLADFSTSWSDQVLSISFQGLDDGRVYTINIATTITDLAGNTAREPSVLRFVAAQPTQADEPFFYVEDWLETWWDMVLLVGVVAMTVMGTAVHLHWGWRRVLMTAFSWFEERMRTARYMGQARMLFYSMNRQMPHSHAERYGSSVAWYWYPFYCLGGIAVLCFVILGITGLILSLYYVPADGGSPSEAYASMENIMENVSFGFMFRAIHHWAANIMIAAVFLHMVRVYFTGAYRNPRELNWVVGVFLLGFTLFYGFSGYLLPWNQLSYWAGTIGLEMCRSVPLMGDWFAELVFGGISLGGATLIRMYFFHVLFLPIITIGMMLVHLIAVYIQGVAEPH